MLDPKDNAIPEEVADAATIEELTDPPRGRGAPKKDPAARLTHSLRLSFTKDQYLDLIVRAADAGFTDVAAWIKSIIKQEG